MIGLLLAAILVTLLGVWWLVPGLLAGAALYLVGLSLLALPLVLWWGWGWRGPKRRAREDYVRRLHAFLDGTGPLPPEGLP